MPREDRMKIFDKLPVFPVSTPAVHASVHTDTHAAPVNHAHATAHPPVDGHDHSHTHTDSHAHAALHADTHTHTDEHAHAHADAHAHDHGHAHGHEHAHDDHGHGHGHDSEMAQIYEVMHSDHRAVQAKIVDAIERLAAPIWRVLAIMGVHVG